MTRSIFQPIRSRRVTAAVARTQHNTQNTKAPALTPATRKTLATIGALWVSFAVTASANASPISTPAKTASMPPKMVAVTAASDDVSERGRDHTPRSENRELDRSRATPGSIESKSTSEAGVVFVTTAKRPDGPTPRTPTPESRPKNDDATAIIAYLMLLSR